VRVRLPGPVGALMLAGCALQQAQQGSASAAPELSWHSDLGEALARAGRENRPVYALSLFGDLSKKC